MFYARLCHWTYKCRHVKYRKEIKTKTKALYDFRLGFVELMKWISVQRSGLAGATRSFPLQA